MKLLLRVPRVRWSVWHSWPAMGVVAAVLIALDWPRVAAFLVLLFSCGWFLLAALALAAMSETRDTPAPELEVGGVPFFRCQCGYLEPASRLSTGGMCLRGCRAPKETA